MDIDECATQSPCHAQVCQRTLMTKIQDQRSKITSGLMLQHSRFVRMCVQERIQGRWKDVQSFVIRLYPIISFKSSADSDSLCGKCDNTTTNCVLTDAGDGYEIFQHFAPHNRNHYDYHFQIQLRVQEWLPKEGRIEYGV